MKEYMFYYQKFKDTREIHEFMKKVVGMEMVTYPESKRVTKVASHTYKQINDYDFSYEMTFIFEVE